MLFDGYAVPMMNELSKLAAAFMPDTKLPAISNFGLFYNKNNTADQWFTVGTGAGEYPFATILEWNNHTYVYSIGNIFFVTFSISRYFVFFFLFSKDRQCTSVDLL